MTPASKKRVFTLTATAVVSLAGCRGVIGIEDLDVRNDAGPGSGDGGTDGPKGGPDSGGPDVTPGGDAGCRSRPTGMDCGKCCHDDATLGPQFMALQKLAVETGCVCGTGACTAASECGSTLCAMVMGGGMECGPCIDGVLRTSTSSACMTLANRCMTDGCKGIYDCIRDCPP